MRLHPAASRVAKLAKETPASFVAFDLLADGRARRSRRPAGERRAQLEALLAQAETAAPPHAGDARPRRSRRSGSRASRAPGSTASSRSRSTGTYEPGKRAMFKVKHARTADCVVAGFRWHKSGPGELVGSLLLGLYDDEGSLHHVGVTSAFTMARRKELATELEPLREHALDDHPWREWAERERRVDADAGRPEPVERRQGSLVGAAADRAGLRGEVRPPAGDRGSATRPCSSAGGPTSAATTAATISSRSRPLTSSRRSSAPGRHRP